MASSSKQKNLSHKCCAAALCNNRSDNRPDLIFHNFPLDENLKKIWDQKMKRGDKKFASNSSLFCCSEHFSDKDYRKSLTGKRRDLVKNAVPMVSWHRRHTNEFWVVCVHNKFCFGAKTNGHPRFVK